MPVSPNKKELAKMKMMGDMGMSANAIGKTLKRNHHTVIACLRRTDFSDPQIQKLIEQVKSSELAELHGIGGKARAILNDYLDDVLDGIREPQLIPITAVLDRTFQQRRLIEGSSTQNIDYHALMKDIEVDEKRLRELEEELRISRLQEEKK